MNIQEQLNSMHKHLMYNKFPYHSVSVVYWEQNLEFHVLFMDEVRELVTDEIKGYIKACGFTYSFVKIDADPKETILHFKKMEEKAIKNWVSLLKKLKIDKVKPKHKWRTHEHT